jgi:hypothetical protein
MRNTHQLTPTQRLISKALVRVRPASLADKLSAPSGLTGSSSKLTTVASSLIPVRISDGSCVSTALVRTGCD